jgi:hypothetical protein
MPETPSLFKATKIKAEDWVKCYQDLLEIARLVSWCMNRDYLNISRRFRLSEGDWGVN